VSPGPGSLGFEILDRRTAYQGFYRLEVLQLRHRLFGGGWSKVLRRELLNMRRAVVVLPYDPAADKVVLVEQFRAGAIDSGDTPWLLEAVAGLAEPGETAEAVARRECLEECGLAPRRLDYALDYASSPGGTSERVSVFIGEVTAPEAGGVFGHVGEGEDILTHVLASEEAFARLERHEIVAVTAVIGLMYLRLNRERLRAAWRSATAPSA
jgi:ADP-ribose pyrophosphatase